MLNINEVLDKSRDIIGREFKAKRWNRRLDKKTIPVTALHFTDEDMDKFNQLTAYLEKELDYGTVLCRSGSLPTNGVDAMNNFGTFLITRTTSCIEILVIDTWCFRIQFRSMGADRDGEQPVYGRQAYLMFWDKCREFHIDLERLAIKDLKEALVTKSFIPTPPVWVDKKYIDKELENVNHIDLNSSYMSGIARAFPILKPVIEYFYKLRKEHKEFKTVLNATTGYFQSAGCKYKFSHLSKAAIEFNNNYLNYLSKELEKSGRKVIAKNTDGIWYQGDIFHSKLEGDNLMQFKTDHKNCKIRFKSAGCYEYIENGEYTPIVRGQTTLDAIKDRSEWNWGDIYNDSIQVIKYSYDENTRRLEKANEGL